MDWFLYDKDLRHERVNKNNGKLFQLSNKLSIARIIINMSLG